MPLKGGRSGISPARGGIGAGFAGALLCTVLVADASSAGEYDAVTGRTWDVTLGVGAMARPTFGGSDRYTVVPAPLGEITWKDTVSLGYDGLSVYWHRDRFRIGVAVTVDPGRDTRHVGTFSFIPGDERLNGLGKIDPAAGFKGFASYRLWGIVFAVSATKYQGKQNTGVVANVAASAPLRLANGFILTPHASAAWADRKYAELYYGVTGMQASRSAFSAYDAKAGLRDVAAGLTLTYAIDHHWSATADVTATQLLGDAKNSPLSFSDTGVRGMTGISYRF